MGSHRSLDDGRLNLLATVGFAALTVAIVAARRDPATEYELSIYAATPEAFWVGMGIAVVCSLILAFGASGRSYTVLGTVLGGTVATGTLALPIIRGYHFHGVHDSVTHVGLERALVEGTAGPFDTLYPGIHSVASFIHAVTPFSIWQSMLFVPVAVAVATFVFVPLVVRRIVDSRTATAAGAFSAFLLPPLHLIANTTHAHPSSQAILFVPVVLYFLVRYLQSGRDTSAGVTSPTGIALLVTVAASILYHPQQALNVLLLLVAVAVVQLVGSRWDRVAAPDHQRIHSVAALSTGVYLLWLVQSPSVFTVVEGALASLREYLAGPSPDTGSSVTSQVGALQAIGSSVPVMFLKLFTVATVFVVLAGLVVLAAYSGRLGNTELSVDRSVVCYFGAGLVAAGPVFLVYLFGSVSMYYFRQAGFMVLVATVLGAVGLAHATDIASRSGVRTSARTALLCAFLVMIPLSTMVLFNSPYLHKANQHVTESRVSGYDLAFEVTDDTAWMAGVRQEPQRYHEALVDIETSGRRDGGVNSTMLYRLQERRPGGWYLVMSQNTYEREVVAYREYRYTRADLAAVDIQPGVHRIHSNGDTELYHVP